LIVEVETVDQIFNAPDANPFAAAESAVLGQAALDRVLTRLQVEPLRNWEGAQLIVRLPAEQITPDQQPHLAAALRRYCAAQIAENRLQVRLSRKQHLFGMTVVTLIVLAVIALAFVLYRTVLADAPTSVLTLIAASISVFAWVILWDPLEALAFDWVAPRRENNVLHRIMKMDLVVRRQD
jgi:hypothetical protein